AKAGRRSFHAKCPMRKLQDRKSMAKSKNAKKQDKSVKQNKARKRAMKNGNGEAGDAHSEELSNKEYTKILKGLHIELVRLQEWVKHAGLKVCIVFEGRDGAGKGGTIKAITERVSPRVFRVVALPAPTDREKSQMYLQRYVRHLRSEERRVGKECRSG